MKSKSLLAYYSKTYPQRRACQWERTTAFLAGQSEGDPRRRVLVINPEDSSDHIHPIELRDAKYRNAPKNDAEVRELLQAIRSHVARLDGPLPDVHPLDPPRWYGAQPDRHPRFVGRFPEMWKIHSALHESDVGAHQQRFRQRHCTGGRPQSSDDSSLRCYCRNPLDPSMNA